MARRKATFGPQDVARLRAKCDTTAALNLLNKAVQGDEKTLASLSTARLKAAEILLRKTLPDTSSVELTGGGGEPLLFTWKTEDTDK